MSYDEYRTSRSLSWERLLRAIRYAKLVAPEFAFQHVAPEAEAPTRFLALLDALVSQNRPSGGRSL